MTAQMRRSCHRARYHRCSLSVLCLCAILIANAGYLILNTFCLLAVPDPMIRDPQIIRMVWIVGRHLGANLGVKHVLCSSRSIRFPCMGRAVVMPRRHSDGIASQSQLETLVLPIKCVGSSWVATAHVNPTLSRRHVHNTIQVFVPSSHYITVPRLYRH
ncbi:hypothetical protein ARMGADRAFT_442298 [Armillaria gallica]|uniref:Uncharacterized protein n=1 Tax=Armillaria gallica TaxID=47427 RepID=A0A2H3DKY4_ARMGA|nr:hypothetical protein ARMGADRAFT_442298 [Armillaria gallica]